MNCLPTRLTISKKVLFTVFGFTKDFGGFLASEMWSLIYNHSAIANCPRIRELLGTEFSYEDIYYKILKYEKTTNQRKLRF